jgi:lipoprotein-anchoring transpeptidase ErfK/SrfK
MRCLAFIFGLILACLAPAAATAEILINVNKSAQRLTVYVDGAPRYHWPISSGLGGGPPSGGYRPERLERKWYSRKYDWAPMPHAIFFHHGYAIHGTNVISRLGRRASHGCVRLHPHHAAILFDMVQSRRSSTRIIVSESSMMARGAPPLPRIIR